MIVEHPDGGHCNTDGMTDDCYGCICYGGGLIKECKERVAKLLDSINNKQQTIMEINFDNLNQAIAALEQCASENKGKLTDTATIRVSDLCSDVATFLRGLVSHGVLQPGEEGTFGQAIGSLKRGFKVARKGWNGKGMWLWLKQETMVKSEWCHDLALKAIADQNGGKIHALGTICMKTADNKILTGWLASQTDMLSEDWVLVDPNE